MRTQLFRVSPSWTRDLWRIIEAAEDQTLHDLYGAIRQAFRLPEGDQYFFYLNGRPHNAPFEYGGPGVSSEERAQVTRLGDLPLRPKKRLLLLAGLEERISLEVQVGGAGEAGHGPQYPRLVGGEGRVPDHPVCPDCGQVHWEELHESPYPPLPASVKALFPELRKTLKRFEARERKWLAEHGDEDALAQGDDALAESTERTAGNDSHAPRDGARQIKVGTGSPGADVPGDRRSPEELAADRRLASHVLAACQGLPDSVDILDGTLDRNVYGWLVDLIWNLFAKKEFQAALEIAERMLTAIPEDTLRFWVPLLLTTADRREEALARIEEHLEEYPDDAEMLLGAALAYKELGMSEPQERCLREALVWVGDDLGEREEIYEALESMLAEAGRSEELERINEEEVRFRERWGLREGIDDELDRAEPEVIPALDAIVEPFVREQPKIGRNEPCPCGSGKKHKRCCGAG